MKQFWMTACLVSATVTLLVSMDRPSSVQQELQDDSQGKLLRQHPQSNLLFDLPDEFTIATDWQGYERLDTESSILFSENDERPMKALIKGFFNPQQLSQMNRKIVSREECVLNGLEGIKVKLTSEREGRKSEIWAVLFGDSYGSCLVLGMVSSKSKEIDSAAVQNAVESVVWDRPERIDPFDHVDYTIDLEVLRVLKYAAKDEGMVMFTFGGGVDTTFNPGRPRLIITKVEKGVASKEDREALVRSQLAEFPGLTDFKVDSLKEIEIDGIKGIEGRASGVSDKFRDLSNNLMTVTLLQVTLFEDDHYYSLNGVISTVIGRNWLQMYQAGIHSFARKPVVVDEEAAKEGDEDPKPVEEPEKK